MRLARALALLILAIGTATPAAAQFRTSVDLGAASITYDDGYRVGAMSLTPMLAIEHARTSLLARGTFSRFETGSHSMSGVVGGSVLSSASARVRGELAAMASGTLPGDGTSTGRALGQLRLHVLGAGGGVWLGAGAGRSGSDGRSQMTRAAEAGAWWRNGALLLAAAVEPARHGDSTYTDARASARWEHDAFELGAGAGVRSGAYATSSTWQAIDATWWVARHVALSAAAGTYLTDPAQATPGGRFMMLGVRLSTHRPGAEALANLHRTARAPLLARSVAERMEIRTSSGERRTILIDAPRARTVELMGDFTHWQIVALAKRRDGRWVITTPIAAGTYRFNIRVDGGEWSVPRGVTTITDDFEGIVGIMTVK